MIHPILNATILLLIYFKTMYDFDTDEIGINLHYINGYIMVLYDTVKIDKNTFNLFDNNGSDVDVKLIFKKCIKLLIKLFILLVIIIAAFMCLFLSEEIPTMKYVFCIIFTFIIVIIVMFIGMYIKDGISKIISNNIDTRHSTSLKLMTKFLFHLNYHILAFYIVFFICSVLMSNDKKNENIMDLASGYANIYMSRIKKLLCVYCMAFIIIIIRNDDRMTLSNLHTVTCLNILVNGFSKLEF